MSIGTCIECGERPYPRTDRTRVVLTKAWEIAQQMGHNYIGPEHILMGIAEDRSSVAYIVLTEMGIDPEKIKEETVKLLT